MKKIIFSGLATLIIMGNFGLSIVEPEGVRPGRGGCVYAGLCMEDI